MRLKRLSLYHYKRPFEFIFKSSHTKRTCADSVIVALEFSGGIVGYGESAPRAYVTGETVPSVCQSVQTEMAPILFRAQIENPEDIAHVLNVIARDNPNPEKRYLSALGSIDLALLDALGHYKGCGAGQFLDRPLRAKAALSLSLPLSTPQDIGRKWQQLQSWLPVKSVKLVMSRNIGSNRERGALIREVIGPDVDLRIEVNGQWTYPEACENLAAMSDLNLSGIEEPLAASDWHELPRLRADFGIPVILDESICTRAEAARAIAAHSCDAINIKVSKCGGLTRSQEIMRMTAQEGLACQVGTHVGESVILDAAGWHLALAAANLTFFEGCSFLLHNAHLSVEGNPPSRTRRTDLPGWGLSQDETGRLLASCDRLAQLDAAGP
jgi:muconate cycloisomerase